jgi:diacylglycerol kinase
MKLIRSFGYAFSGLYHALRDQRNLRIHFIIALLVVVASAYFQITSAEWVLLLIMISLVISLELVNSAIENLTNLVTIENNPLAGRVKDIAAAAVLFSSIIAATIGFIIFLKYIFPNA